jgi:cell wall-associated NlpC family hydrolase
VHIALATVIASSGAVVTTALTAGVAHATTTPVAAAASADSTVSGSITRSEVLERARYWYDRRANFVYNQGGSYRDSTGTPYRTDCSGYVSMAWHLGYSPNTVGLADYETYEIPRSQLKPGDILNSYYDHVILFEKWDDAAHTTFSYYSFGHTPVVHRTGVSINATLDGHPNGDYKALRYKKIVDDSGNPTTLPSGTLVKSANGALVKVIIAGSGLAVAGSDVGPDNYDLSKIVIVDDSPFNDLPTSPPSGTVVHDQAGGSSRYVVVDGAALPISEAEWTADGYNRRPVMGVPGTWLRTAAAKTPSTGTVLMDQSDTDANRYVMVNGAALHISEAEWANDDYRLRPLIGVPGTWLQAAVARPLPNKTVVTAHTNGNGSIYVMAGGMAVPLSYADFIGMGYDKAPLMGIPDAWLAALAAKSAPSVGTLLRSPDSPTIWLTVSGGEKALTSADFGPGKYSYDDIVTVPTALTTQLPTVA